jgi:hypothetical protein
VRSGEKFVFLGRLRCRAVDECDELESRFVGWTRAECVPRPKVMQEKS